MSAAVIVRSTLRISKKYEMCQNRLHAHIFDQPYPSDESLPYHLVPRCQPSLHINSHTIDLICRAALHQVREHFRTFPPSHGKKVPSCIKRIRTRALDPMMKSFTYQLILRLTSDYCSLPWSRVGRGVMILNLLSEGRGVGCRAVGIRYGFSSSMTWALTRVVNAYRTY